jgi:hypothetical protein
LINDVGVDLMLFIFCFVGIKISNLLMSMLLLCLLSETVVGLFNSFNPDSVVAVVVVVAVWLFDCRCSSTVFCVL